MFIDRAWDEAEASLVGAPDRNMLPAGVTIGVFVVPVWACTWENVEFLAKVDCPWGMGVRTDRMLPLVLPSLCTVDCSTPRGV